MALNRRSFLRGLSGMLVWQQKQSSLSAEGKKRVVWRDFVLVA